MEDNEEDVYESSNLQESVLKEITSYMSDLRFKRSNGRRPSLSRRSFSMTLNTPEGGGAASKMENALLLKLGSGSNDLQIPQDGPFSSRALGKHGA